MNGPFSFEIKKAACNRLLLILSGFCPVFGFLTPSKVAGVVGFEPTANGFGDHYSKIIDKNNEPLISQGSLFGVYFS